MNRQSRNSKRQALSSTPPLKLPKLSQSTPSSPNSQLNLVDVGSNIYPVAMVPYNDDDTKTLYNFLIDVILSFDRTVPSAGTDKSFDWVVTVRLEIDAGNVNCLRALQRTLNKTVPRQDSEFKDLVGSYFLTLVCIPVNNAISHNTHVDALLGISNQLNVQTETNLCLPH